MKKKPNKRTVVTLIAYTGAALILGRFDFVHETEFLRWVMTTVVIVLGGVLIYTLGDLPQWGRIRSRLTSALIFGGIILFSMLVPIVVHCLCFPQAQLHENEFLSFYGDYLGFLGAFTLGYAVYQRDGQIRKEAKIRDAKLLYSCINSVIEQIHAVKDGRRRIRRIEYDSQWSLYYHEIASIQFAHEIDLRKKIECIFKTVERINKYLDQEEWDKAQACCAKFINDEQLSTAKYNFIEACSKIYNIAYLEEFSDLLPCWDEQEDVLKLTNSYSDLFIWPLEDYIWTHMTKSGVEHMDASELTNDLVDWLQKIDELKPFIKSPYDRRILAKIVFETNLKIQREAGSRISYCWGEYSLRQSASSET